MVPKSKSDYFIILNENNFHDQKTFWKTKKPLLSDLKMAEYSNRDPFPNNINVPVLKFPVKYSSHPDILALEETCSETSISSFSFWKINRKKILRQRISRYSYSHDNYQTEYGYICWCPSFKFNNFLDKTIVMWKNISYGFDNTPYWLAGTIDESTELPNRGKRL